MILTVVALLLAAACDTVSSWIRDGEVVASIGKHKLYLSEVESYIPSGISKEDSTTLARNYINSWASDQKMLEVAESQLSKEEKDVSRELEEYRRTLLRYRYEQKYVNQRLDTIITAREIETYYDEHPDNFVLQVPILKARFLSISSDNPNLSTIRRKMSSSDESELVAADSIAYSSATRYTGYDGKWIDATVLAREFGTDYASMLGRMKDKFIEINDGNGSVGVAFVYDMVKAGEQGPVEYYESRIRDIILSARKQKLLRDLEKDVSSRALKEGNYDIK